VADAKGRVELAPSSGDSVYIRSTNTACADADINITVSERLRLELYDNIISAHVSPSITPLKGRGSTYLLLGKLGPILVLLHHEPLESVWVTHIDYLLST
jgi:hypothetical protein